MILFLSPKLTPVCVDLSDWDSSRAAVESCLPVEMLVNNVGAGSTEPFEEVTEAGVDRLMAVNFKSMINVTQVAMNKRLLFCAYNRWAGRKLYLTRKIIDR